MAKTDQVREWYHRFVVLNHHSRGSIGYEPICNHKQPTVQFPNDSGGVYIEPVHPLTVEAWEAYVTVMNHHGETMTGAGGVNQCRNIGDSNWPSLHAYLCAVDLPPNSRKSAAFIGDMGKIKTNNGAFVFRNLVGDRMHDQIDCSPADLATGIDPTTVIGEEEMPTAEEIAEAVIAAMPTLDDVSQAVWSMGNRTGAISVWLALDRNYRNIGELVIAHRAGTLGADLGDDDDIEALVDAIVTAGLEQKVLDGLEAARRLAE